MAGITGLGGVFVKAGAKPEALDWYKQKLGLQLEDWGGINFNWRNADDPDRKGYSLFSLFDRDTDYFGESGQDTMVNFRVDDLDAYLTDLKAAGVKVLDHIEEGDYGRFAWVEDPQGIRVELREPPEGERG